MPDWLGERGAGELFVNVVRAKDTVDRISFLGLDGCFYDAYASGLGGNPCLGGRRSSNDADPNAEPLVFTSRDYFRELITGNTRGEFKTQVTEPYVPGGLAEKQITMRAAVIHDGQVAGAVTVSQTLAGLARD